MKMFIEASGETQTPAGRAWQFTKKWGGIISIAVKCPINILLPNNPYRDVLS